MKDNHTQAQELLKEWAKEQIEGKWAVFYEQQELFGEKWEKECCSHLKDIPLTESQARDCARFLEGLNEDVKSNFCSRIRNVRVERVG